MPGAGLGAARRPRLPRCVGGIRRPRRPAPPPWWAGYPAGCFGLRGRRRRVGGLGRFRRAPLRRSSGQLPQAPPGDRDRRRGAWFGQGAAALLRAAVEAGGVAAQAEDQWDRDIFRHREADRAEGGEAEGDDLGDREEVGRVARGVGVDGLDRGGLGRTGSPSVAVEENRCQGGGDELHEHVGVAGFRFGHASRPGLRLLFGFSAMLGILSSLNSYAWVAGCGLDRICVWGGGAWIFSGLSGRRALFVCICVHLWFQTLLGNRRRGWLRQRNGTTDEHRYTQIS